MPDREEQTWQELPKISILVSQRLFQDKFINIENQFFTPAAPHDSIPTIADESKYFEFASIQWGIF